MPRKKKPQAALDAVIEKAGLVPASELAEAEPPPRELIDPTPDITRPRPSPARNGQEYPSFAEKIALQKKERPTGPRKRDGEPAASFASDDLRIIKDGQTWQVRAERELTGNEKDRLAASGFQAVDDDEQVWNASQKELAARGTDVNHIAMALGKSEGRGR